MMRNVNNHSGWRRLASALPIVAGLAGVAGIAGAAIGFGKQRWQAETREIRARLAAAQRPVVPRTVDIDALAALPLPAQRFFRTVLKDGQRMVTGVRIRHRGTFNLSVSGERWFPFTSEEQVVIQRPGFDWDGRIAVLPGVHVHVHDAYVAGEGILQASLLGLVTVARLQDSGDIAKGELMRYLAEAAWYPTALLPGYGVYWEAVDANAAKVTLDDDHLSVTLHFTFHDAGWIDTVRAEARGRTVDGRIVPTPWMGRFWNYAQRDGMSIPLDGEVMWLLPDGPKPYWRGRLTDIAYRFAP
jgi:hypothetical protein